LARGRSSELTADDAAEALGVHRNVARARLDRLAAAGLLDVSFERRTGRTGPGAGRPAKVYRVAPETRAVEFPPRRLAALVGRLLDELPEPGRARVLRRVGEDSGRELAEAAQVEPYAARDDATVHACELQQLVADALDVAHAGELGEALVPLAQLLGQRRDEHGRRSR